VTKHFLLAVVLVTGCRGSISDKPPIHLVPDMDWQKKFQALEAADIVRPNGRPLFAEGRVMRPLVAGTVPVGELREDDAYFRGVVGDKYVARAPVNVDEKLISRGQERFQIYCTPCHDATGSGNGMAVQRGYPKPVDLNSERVRTMADGQVFDTISVGKGNMPPYRKQIPVEDRWAIVTWLRVLQRSQSAKIDDVPAEQRDQVEAPGTTK
jgi:mono/diheme cytochrome c family protein